MAPDHRQTNDVPGLERSCATPGVDPAGNYRSVPMHCLICEHSFPRFEAYGPFARPGRCPRCAAKPRHRAIAWYLQTRFAPRAAPESRVLEIGANAVTLRTLLVPRFLGPAVYVNVDLRRLDAHRKVRAPHACVVGSVEQLPFADAAFALILCNHVLPAVGRDGLALSEIRRCLAPDGRALINVPIEGPSTRLTPVLRREHPEWTDQYVADHCPYRVYGEDFLELAAWNGLVGERLRPWAARDPAFLAENGLRPTEVLLQFRPHGERPLRSAPQKPRAVALRPWRIDAVR